MPRVRTGLWILVISSSRTFILTVDTLIRKYFRYLKVFLLRELSSSELGLGTLAVLLVSRWRTLTL